MKPLSPFPAPTPRRSSRAAWLLALALVACGGGQGSPDDLSPEDERDAADDPGADPDAGLPDAGDDDGEEDADLDAGAQDADGDDADVPGDADALDDAGPDEPPEPLELTPNKGLAEGFHVAPVMPEAGETFSMIVASDPQLWWNFIDGQEGISDEVVEERNQLHIDAMNALIGGTGLPEETPAPLGVILNGDLTEYGRWSQWDAYYRLYMQVEAPLWEGMGNHEYENNNPFVSNGCGPQPSDGGVWSEACRRAPMETLWGEPACQVFQNMVDDLFSWCATDAMRRWRWWLEQRRDVLFDFDPGSGAYSWEMGDFHFIQLHNEPDYEVPEATICSALPWLQNDLRVAFERGRRIVLNMHKPPSSALNAHLEGYEYHVVAIFFGHHHRNVGYTGDTVIKGVPIPRFYSGSVEWNVFALARFGPESLTVTSIDTDSGAPIHHPRAEDYEGGVRAAAPFTYAYPTHDCPAGQVPDGVGGPCFAPAFEPVPVEPCQP